MIVDRDYSFYKPIEKLKGWDIFYIELPFDVCKRFGKANPELYALIEGIESKGKFIMKMTNTGKYIFIIRDDILKRIGKKNGEYIRVRFKDFKI